MFNFREFMAVLLIVSLICPADALARGGRGGGGRGGGGGGRSMGGGGYGGGSMSRAPSMSRPSMPSSRPNPSRPSPSRPAASRPSTGGARPATGVVGNRPAAGSGARPGAGNANRPGEGNMAGRDRPTAGQLNNFLDIPSQGSRPSGGRPAAGNLPAGGNTAIADFFQTGGGNAGAGASNRAGQIANRAEGASGERAGQLSDRAADRSAAGSVADYRSDRISDRTDARSDLRDNRGEARDFASDNRGERVENRGDRQSVRVENRGDLRSNLADGRGDRRTERQQQLGDRADNIRDQINDHYDHDHLFDDFWADHPQAHYRFHQNPVFWTWASFATVSAFMPWNWGTGYYYDYGSGGGSYAGDSSTVYADESTYSSPEYCEQAEELATSAPEEAPADAEWLPLGVFAMTVDDNSGALPNMFLQLAISKEGIIAGTYQNKTTGKTESVEGMVDKESQRAAWTILGKNTPIMETGLQNLTMNETRAVVHFADGTTQRWLLVRVENPESSQTDAAATGN